MKTVNLKKFQYIGTMVDNFGETKIRWVNTEQNIRTYEKQRHTEGVFFISMTPLNKLEAVLFLKGRPSFQDKRNQTVLQDWLDNNQAEYEKAMKDAGQTLYTPTYEDILLYEHEEEELLHETEEYNTDETEETLNDLNEHLETA